MDDFNDKIAVVTGGGSGMGREIVRQLAAAGARVAACDLSMDGLEKTEALVREDHPDAEILTFRADVSSETDLEGLRDAVCQTFETEHINLLFNNAGIAGGGSMFTASRESWERTFDVTWSGVYLGCRVFLPLLAASTEGYVVNTSSVNGFYASIGPDRPHTAYSAAKFAVKGFTEALMTDLQINAPHVKAAVVMPGHIGTGIVRNTMRAQVGEPTPEEAEFLVAAQEMFETTAPMTAAEAARVILDGVRAERWRILVGDDAVELDEKVRADPENAYQAGFFTLLG